MNLRKTMIVGFAGCAALAMTACGSSDPEPTASPTTSSSGGGVVACENPPAEPTAADLQNVLDTALDPAVPTAEKVDLIQGGADDPAVWDELAKKFAETQGVTYSISTAAGSIAMIDDCNASAILSLQLGADSQPSQTPIDFVAEDGVWKLSRTHACQLVATMAIQTTLCPSA